MNDVCWVVGDDAFVVADGLCLVEVKRHEDDLFVDSNDGYDGVFVVEVKRYEDDLFVDLNDDYDDVYLH